MPYPCDKPSNSFVFEAIRAQNLQIPLVLEPSVPKTFEFLRKFNDTQGRDRLAATNGKLANLQRAVKSRGIPTENVFSTRGGFASQRRQRSRAALVALAKKKI